MKLLAQIVATDLGKIEGAGLGPFGQKVQTTGLEVGKNFTTAISSIIGFLTISGTVWFMFQLLIGGISWVSSGGDKAKIESSRDRITHAFIGLTIVVASWGIIALIGQFLGFDLLIPDPGKLMDSLKIK